MSELDEWVAAVNGALGLDVEVDRALVLDLARDVAHGVARPAAPLTTYVLGVAVGRGEQVGTTPDTLAEIVRTLAASWSSAP